MISMSLSKLQINIDEDLKIKFKMLTVKNKENMTDILVKAIEEYVEENENKTE